MEQSRIWHYFQTQAPHAFAGAAMRLLHLAGRLPRNGITVNVGVGSGQLERILVARGLAVVTVDPDVASLRTALGTPGNAIAADIRALPFADRSVDALVASEVLEHLDDATLTAGLAEVARILGPGGLFLGTVPFEEDLSASMTVCPHCGEVFHKVGHVRSFNATSLRSTLEAHFATVNVQRRAFMNSSDTGVFKRALGWLRNVLVVRNILTRETSLVFEARTRSG